MSNTNIATTIYKYRNLERLVVDTAPDANLYYFFVGDHIPHANDDLLPIDNSVKNIGDAYTKMILGKLLHSYSNFAPVIRNIPYESNKVFTMYDDQVDLEGEDFYCITAEGSYNHIWKCLDNNNGANSTVQPVFSEGADTILYQTSDGYRWKYLTSVSNSVVDTFMTSKYFPLVVNNAVANSAVGGSLDTIKVITMGKYYNNYIDGTFRATDLRINGDSKVYNISNNAAITSNGYYTGCLLYLIGGTGQGQFATITDYVSNTEGNYMMIDNEFLVAPLNGTTYEIRPQVEIYSVDMPTINCVARALVNTVGSNSIYRIEVLQRGEGYVAAGANVVANDIVGLVPENIASIRPILPPFGGHGSSIAKELYCHDVELSVKLSNSESNTIPTSNRFQQIGIIRNPRFANVNLQLTGTQGQFTPNENIMAVNPIQINTNCTITVNSTTISCNNANFMGQTAAGVPLLMVNLEGTAAQLLVIDTITSNTELEVGSNASFSCTEAKMYFANIVAVVTCSEVQGPGDILIANTGGNLYIDQLVVGTNTGAFGYISKIIRNGVEKTFLTYNQLYKYDATLISGSFSQNEVVVQGNTSAYIHSIEGSAPNITLYVSGFTNGTFLEDLTVLGNTSGAMADITKIYSRELVYGSGEILYLENVDPIEREANQNEQFQIILNF